MGLKDISFSFIDVLVILVVLLGPPLVISSIITCVLFSRHGIIRSHPTRVIITLFATAFISSVVLIALQHVLPKSLKFQGSYGMFFLGHSWPIYPLSFVVVAVVPIATVWWTYRNVLSNNTSNPDALKRAG